MTSTSAGSIAQPALEPTGLQRWLPVLTWLPGYQRGWLRDDVTAGLALSALLVPQGMAYAQLAGLPPITGLYTSIMCLLAYAITGPSRVLVLGPDSALGPLIAASVVPLAIAHGDPGRAVLLASMQAVLVGLFMIGAGVAKLGFIADLLSAPIQLGYMNGLALTIVIGQIRKLGGFSVDADGLIEEVSETARQLAAGAANPAALTIGLISLVIVLGMDRLLPRIPAVLAAVIVATFASTVLGLAAMGVKTVGALPRGFPPFAIPVVTPSELGALLVGALGVTLVALTDTISTSSAYARRAGTPVDADQEMVGIGTANLLAGLFTGFAVSTSGSRTAVAFKAGARTQVTGLIGAATILLLLVALPGALAALPLPTLAAIVIAAALSMADLGAVRRLWHQRRTEFWLSMAAMAAVALLGVLPGILVAVSLSILNVFRRAWWPYQARLGRIPGRPGYRDLEHAPNAVQLTGMVIFRFDAPLIFANARTFSEQVIRLADADPRPRWIVIAAEPISDIDTTAAAMLGELLDELDNRGVQLVFAELKTVIRHRLTSYGMTALENRVITKPTLNSAWKAYRREFSVVDPRKVARAARAAQSPPSAFAPSSPPVSQSDTAAPVGPAE